MTRDGQSACEACGERPASRVIERVGRDNFPLAGSLGNDAQALPAASRSPRVCALCLLAIQWLPLGAIMFKGRLACFQFTHALLSRLFVEETYREIRARLPTPNAKGKVTVPGSGEGATPATLILLDRMRKLQLDREDYDLPPYITLNIWAFTNSGASPDCEVIEIENPALQFLWRAAREHYVEIKDLLKREDPKKPGTHLLSAIERRSDYSGFYPRKAGKGRGSTPPASEELYELYQTQILNRPRAALLTAKRLAAAAYTHLSKGDRKQKKLLEQTLKESPRWSKGKEARGYLRRLFAALAENGELTLDSYARLFPATNLDTAEVTPETALSFWHQPGRAVRASVHGWDVFWFYLHHISDRASGRDETLTEGEGDLAMFTNPMIQAFARDVFDYFMEEKGGRDHERGLAYIKRHVLESFSRGKITNNVLRQWFCKLAETREGYRCEDWDALCRDEQGNDSTGELRFQMRLELANLHRQAAQAAPAT